MKEGTFREGEHHGSTRYRLVVLSNEAEAGEQSHEDNIDIQRQIASTLPI
jgi:hypothetical protein